MRLGLRLAGFFNDLKMGVIKLAAEKAVFCFIKHPARQKS
jgi:hypothetical protein